MLYILSQEGQNISFFVSIEKVSSISPTFASRVEGNFRILPHYLQHYPNQTTNCFCLTFSASFMSEQIHMISIISYSFITWGMGGLPDKIPLFSFYMERTYSCPFFLP